MKPSKKGIKVEGTRPSWVVGHGAWHVQKIY
jgi:hypothetical protein